MLKLKCADYVLTLAPERGGGIAAFSWRDKAVMRPVCGLSPLDLACFPLVPFSNRIAHGRFSWNGRQVSLQPNLPGSDHPHTLHGFGWLAAWQITAQSESSATLEHRYDGKGEWPWPYRAEQSFELSEQGLTVYLSIENLGQEVMPAGLGLHPYFPRDAGTRYIGMHRGEWQNSAECLPQTLIEHDHAIDWWNGLPIGDRAVDTLYTGREGELNIIWPSRKMALAISPSASLGATVVYSPADETYFCVEPVSHMTDAVNRTDGRDPIFSLLPGDVMKASAAFSVMEFTT